MARRIAVRIIWSAVMVGAFTACATQRTLSPLALPLSSSTTATGIASWYGPGFDGHRTSSGAVYQRDGMTAASTLFPLGTRLRVTNLENGRTAEVEVNDHGPFVKGRRLDLSHQAAVKLGMIGHGTAPVRMEVLATPPGGPALGLRYFVQVGSFVNAANARMLRERLATSYPEVRVTVAEEDGERHYRVRLGAYADRDQAEHCARHLARLGYDTRVITE